MWFCVRSTCWLANRASANILMPTTMAATAMMPMIDDQMRRAIDSVRLALIDEYGVQEQPEPDESDEENHITQADDAAGEVLEPIDHRDAPSDVTEYRQVV